MNERDFDFLEYINSIEQMMIAWYEYSQKALKNSANLGNAREHFIREVLQKFLPKTVIVGSGEITDGKLRSNQQDIIIYRADFPVISGFDFVNAYLIEGVIATIEVKSDLKTGSPNHLHKALKNIQTVLSLTNQARMISGTREQQQELQKIHTVKTYVVGYKGWNSKTKILENYASAANEVGWQIPDMVYQPNSCIVKNTDIANFRHIDTHQPVPPDLTPIAYCSKYPFALLFQNLLRSIMAVTGPIATDHESKATMKYDFNNYFSLPNIPCEQITLKSVTG